MAGQISINNLNNSLKDIIEQNGLSEEQVTALVQELLGSYYTKTEIGTLSSLSTTNKSIVGAINELFQSANNGKQIIANAIGEPLSSNDTFSAMGNEIEEMLEYFRDKLISVGVTDSLDNLKLKELIDKVNIQYYSFSITKNLTNCTINNNATIINRNSSYNATISAISNGVMKSIKVTMGGVDITSTAVTGNDINITSVTGDIVITANAVVNPYEPGTNVNNAGSSINAYQYNPKTLTIPVEADGKYTLSFSYGPNISNQGYTASISVGVYDADGNKIDSYSDSTKTSGSFSKTLSLKKGYKIQITASISVTTNNAHCNQVTGIKLVFKSL